jgi:hypothetical protein
VSFHPTNAAVFAVGSCDLTFGSSNTNDGSVMIVTLTSATQQTVDGSIISSYSSLITHPSGTSGTKFGYSLSYVADLNCDSVADLLVGEYSTSATSPSKIFLLFMSSTNTMLSYQMFSNPDVPTTSWGRMVSVTNFLNPYENNNYSGLVNVFVANPDYSASSTKQGKLYNLNIVYGNCSTSPLPVLGYSFGTVTVPAVPLTTVSVACATGYNGTPSVTQIQCLCAAWSPTTFTGCTIISCSSSPAQTGYIFTAGLSTYLSSRTASCATGYTGTASSISCLESASWSSSSGCNADCPASPTQTGYTIATGSSTHGSTRTVTCATGYTGTAASVTCSDGTWSPSSGRTIVSCSATPTQTGYAIAPGASTYQSTRTVSCATGYTGTASSI